MTRTPEDFRSAHERMLAELTRRGEALLSGPVLEETPPDEDVAFVFELIHMARALEYHLGRVTAQFDMTALQARFAWIMATTPWPMPQVNVQIALGISQAGASQMVARMRDRGLVTTDVNPSGWGGLVVELTAHGMAQWQRLKDTLRTVTGELDDAVGTERGRRFRRQAGAIIALDERHEYFEALRNPRSILS